MFGAEAWKKKTVTNLYSPAVSIDERKCQATENKGKRQFGVGFLSHPPAIEGDLKRRDVRHFGHSRSDSFDACVPAGETRVGVDVCYVQLGTSQRLAGVVP